MDDEYFPDSDLDDVLCLQAFRAFHDLERHAVALIEALEPLTEDAGVMDEHIRSMFPGDETIAFGVVEPLHCSLLCHENLSPYSRNVASVPLLADRRVAQLQVTPFAAAGPALATIF